MVKGEHTNKLKLFGFELDPCKQPVEINHKTPHENEQEISPANSSSNSTVSSQKEEEPPNKSQQIITAEEKGKEFVCQYCYKRFANSQALGGHQNAHKKERMRKKRLQLQARTASINYYLQQPFQLPNEHVYNYDINSSNFTVFPDESLQSDHHQISFSSSSYGGHGRLVNYGSGYGYGPIIQQNPCKFSLTHVENSNQSK